jgi:type VI secretion system protein ImpH
MTAEPIALPESAALVRLLMEQPYRFELFQAIRILELEETRRALAEGRAAPPGVGGVDRGAAVHSPVRFLSSASLKFPASAITRAWVNESVEPLHPGDTGNRVTQLEVTCLGLIGTSGTLPSHYTSIIADRYRRFRDDTLKSFLDLFVQRFVGLNYRAWCKYRQDVRFEHAAISGRSSSWDTSSEPVDSFTAVVAALVGLAGHDVSSRMEVDDHVIFHYSSHFSRSVRTAASLEKLLRDQLSVDACVEQFVGRWLELELPDQTSLASRMLPEGLHAQLGQGALLGKRVWDIESTFEVILGPLTAGQLKQFLPGTPALARLADLLRLYAGLTFEIVVRLKLKASEVPCCRLGGMTLRGDGHATELDPLLGWTTWLVSQEGADLDRSDTAFALKR